MSEYRSPEEDQLQDEDHARINAVLDQAVIDGGSLFAAMKLKEPQDVIELWCDRLWGGLRDGLVDGRKRCPEAPLLPREDRLSAIVMLLEDRMFAESKKVLDAVREAAE
jgi:hypothetical protein